MNDSIYIASIYRLTGVNFWESAKVLSERLDLDERGVPRRFTALPLYFLASHAAELSLKAALLKRGFAEQDLRQFSYRHNLERLLAALVEKGVTVTPGTPVGRMAAPGDIQPAKARYGAAVVDLGPRGAQMRGGKIRMPELVRTLSMLLARSVIDKTGFAEFFDLQLDFVPDDTTPAMPPPPPDSGISGVSIAQALQQQPGLRLESTRGPVQFIVVDQAERPSAN